MFKLNLTFLVLALVFAVLSTMTLQQEVNGATTIKDKFFKLLGSKIHLK